MVGWWRCWRVCGRIARWKFEMGREGRARLYDLDWVGNDGYVVSLLLVPALVFGGFDLLLGDWE